MKLIIRSTIAAVFLFGLAMPLFAANDVAVHINPPVGNCLTVSLKNMGAPVVVQFADMSVYDKMCKRVCSSETKLGKPLKLCESMTFRICCQTSLAGKICRVRVHHSGGVNEQWYP